MAAPLVGSVEFAPEVVVKLRQAAGLRVLQEQRDGANNQVVELRADIAVLDARLRAEINNAQALRANLEATLAIVETLRGKNVELEARVTELSAAKSTKSPAKTK